MNQPHQYAKYNELQKTDASYVLDSYLRLIRWKSIERNETILDIGCGDGDVLYEILLPKLPQNFQKLYAIDISDEFVDYASKRNRNTRIIFEQFDIASNQLPIKYWEQFDHIFSFYCLHWVADQKKAIQNIYKMLKPDGDMLLTFLATNPIYDIYEILSKTKKWSKYMYDVNKFISPYHYLKNPEMEMENLLKEQGFISLSCRAIARSFTFPNFTSLAKAVESVNPFISRLPSDQIENYINDYVGEVRKLNNVTIETTINNNNNNNNEDDGKIHFTYKLFVVFATKPEK